MFDLLNDFANKLRDRKTGYQSHWKTGRFDFTDKKNKLGTVELLTPEEKKKLEEYTSGKARP